MLNPNNDRLDYGQVLAPPAGYKLDFAVATTYSLDLDALVGACIALGLSAETDSDLMKNPVCLLEALRATGDKVALFCEAGQISKPNNITSLYILLEKMVFQVATAKHRGIAKYPSFHPKFWLLRYINDDKEYLYRVVVLSRNMTFDRSWDVTFYMDGHTTGRKTLKNTPVADFLSYLCNQPPNDQSAKEKQRKIRALIRELQYVKFETNSKEFYDFDFIPVGVKAANGGFYNITGYPLFADSFHEVFIMTPFLSDGIIKEFNNRNKVITNSECVLITRAMSLSKLKVNDCNNFKIFTMKDAVIDGESAISDDGAEEKKQDIHAKIYMVRKYSDTDLYLGSLNASNNAIGGNIEFMIRLRSKNRYLNISKLTQSLFGGNADDPQNPFAEVKLSDIGEAEEDDDSLNSLTGALKDFIRLNPTATVKSNGGSFDINVSVPEFKAEYEMNLSPMLSNKSETITENMIFSSLQLMQLSDFYKVTVSDSENSIQRIIKIPTDNLPEDREKAVISSIVSDKQCFYRYIAFLLGDNFVLSSLESQQEIGEANSLAKSHTQLPAIYEKMLQTAATAPERFNEIDYLIKAISKDGVIPEDFEALYKTFRKAVKPNG